MDALSFQTTHRLQTKHARERGERGVAWHAAWLNQSLSTIPIVSYVFCEANKNQCGSEAFKCVSQNFEQMRFIMGSAEVETAARKAKRKEAHENARKSGSKWCERKKWQRAAGSTRRTETMNSLLFTTLRMTKPFGPRKFVCFHLIQLRCVHEWTAVVQSVTIVVGWPHQWPIDQYKTNLARLTFIT